MDIVHHLMFVCEVIFHRHGINLYKFDEWKYARRCAATSSEMDCKTQIRSILDILRREVGLSKATYHEQLIAIKALDAEIDSLLKTKTADLISMAGSIHSQSNPL